ncbi:glutathione S-transferase family protein [Stenotrophomonas sp. Iso1]|uniref:glutathione S-transferase family protein n=1 Tax=Stenotrophomonas sp. Iso1 TaxID=2977283 RepID=UPI0022B7D213|nr:glutathione S-transferase family protein [Stenotrophomonas sp. Iso1]
MTAKLTFYTHPYSRARVARWMLEETGLPYEDVLLHFDTTMKSPDYLALNPMGKVPALRHGETVITENAAICLHLADLVPEKALLPAIGTPARGACYRWVLLAAGPLEGFITARRHGALAPAREAGYGNPADLMRTLEGAVAGKKYLVGGTFTVADLYLAAVLSYYIQVGELEASAVFEDYFTPHLQRPAAVRGNAIDDALVTAGAA